MGNSKLWFFIFVLILFGCNKSASTPAPNVTATEKKEPSASEPKGAEPPANFIEGNIDEAAAMYFLYNEYDFDDKNSIWDLDDEEGKKYNFEQPGRVYSTTIFSKEFTQNNKKRFVIITETKPKDFDCHACAPLIGGATFTQNGNKWVLDTMNLGLSVFGSHGNGPGAKLVQLGKDRFGILLEGGYSNMGYTTEAKSYVAEVNKNLVEVLSISDTAGNNHGDCGEEEKGGEGSKPCWEFDSTIDYFPNDKSELYDIVITRSGTREKEEEDKDPKFKEVVTYTFDGSKYIEKKK